MTDLDFRTVSYRLWRLRRLIGVSALLPLPGILFAQIFGVGLTFGGGGGIILLLWIATVLALAIRFPNGWVDHFALGLPLAAITFLSPIAWLVGIGPLGGIALGLLVMAVGWFLINSRLPLILSDLPMGTQKQTFRAKTAIPADKLQEALFMRPNAQCGLHACGPAGPDGLFEVRAFGYRMLDDTFTPEDSGISFKAKVVERDERMQITQFFLDDGKVTASTTYEEITPKRKGSVYAKEEVHDHFTAFAALGFWLNDVEADHFTALLDFLAEAPPRALKLMPQDSLLTWVAQRFLARMVEDAA